MARRSRKRPYGEGHRPLDMGRLASLPREVSRGKRSFRVQQVASGRKTYTCPGCLHPIAAGQPHIVAWRTDEFISAERMVDGRRHWHTACWRRGLHPA